MKQHFLLLLLFSSHLLSAQNVGIGTVSPEGKLHVVSDALYYNALFQGTATGFGSYIAFREAGYSTGARIGVHSNALTLDAGFGFGTTGIHFRIEGFSKMFISSAGRVGIGTFSPAYKLHVVDGDIGITNGDLTVGLWSISSSISGLEIPDGSLSLSNSTRGIILNGADRPMITRGFDAFTSGFYTGLGRWGLFMEPSRLTFGIPNLVNKGWEFATYEENSTRNVVMQIDRAGTLRRPAQTNNADLLPIALGNVKADGTLQGGSGNFTCSRTGNGLYKIVFNGITYSDANYIVIATPVRQSNTDCFIQTRQGLSGDLNVFIRSVSNIPTDQPFHFVMYKN